MKVKVNAKLRNCEVECSGLIEILFQTNKQAYASWQIFSDRKLLASQSKCHFVGDVNFCENEIVERVRKRIESYCINRKRVFEKVTTDYSATSVTQQLP